jgi:hypothetical protein
MIYKFDSALNLYGLWQSFARLSLTARLDAKKVTYDLGHESVAFTLDTYGHVVKKMCLNASGKTAGILFPKSAGRD